MAKPPAGWKRSAANNTRPGRRARQCRPPTNPDYSSELDNLSRKAQVPPGTTKLHRLDENIGAVLVELTPDDLRDIDNAASKITVHGARYPEKLEQITGR